MDGMGPSTDGSIRLTTLVPDPRNARRHGARSLAPIAAALREDGAALAGNAAAAAERAGPTRARVVQADDAV